jgi:hypothetical protein
MTGMERSATRSRMDRGRCRRYPGAMALRGFGVLASVCLLTGCGTGAGARGYPLYTSPGAPLAGNQVATLGTTFALGLGPGGGATSFIKTVDGRDVSTLDSYFELLPGCHVVSTGTQLLFSHMGATWQRQYPPHFFIFDMKAGHAYRVVVQLKEKMNGFASLVVDGTEQDPSGKETRSFNPVPGFAARQACAQPAAPVSPVPPAGG